MAMMKHLDKYPFLNALAAGAYIVALVSLMNAAGSLTAGKGDSILTGMAMLGLFVLSAAVMGFLFLYQPLRLLVEGHTREAVSFFLRIVGSFAALVAAAVAVILLLAFL